MSMCFCENLLMGLVVICSQAPTGTHGHPRAPTGTPNPTGTRAHGHTGTPKPTGTRAHGHTGKAAYRTRLDVVVLKFFFESDFVHFLFRSGSSRFSFVFLRVITLIFTSFFVFDTTIIYNASLSWLSLFPPKNNKNIQNYQWQTHETS